MDALDQTGNDKLAASIDPTINFFGMTNYRNQNRRFGIKIDDRRRHMYLVGKTGMGKTTILENMVINDIYSGHGIGLVDPHGDFAEKVLNFVPANRINDIVYFNPSDIDYPIGFNILESINPDYKHLVTSGLMGVFKKIWPDVWSARMEYILNNTILALLDFPGTTLLGINRLLADNEYRKRVVANLKDPVVKAFWQTEFAGYSDKYKQEAVAPIQNKIGQFLSASIIRNIVAQVKSRINIREIMDTKKIFIMNLSKGRIGEDNSRLLGGMLITKIQLSAMERVDMLEKDRSDFFLYVDEFQNFATESFAHILSEARKYRLDLIMAHQYMEQLDETVLAAVIGNVGTMVTFRVGSSDAEVLAKEFIPTFVEEDLVNLPKYHVYLKLMIDGVASRPFSAMTLPPIGSPTGSMEKVIRVSRERYAVNRNTIEDKIAKWSGMIINAEDVEAEMALGPDVVTFKEDLPPAPAPVATPSPVAAVSTPAPLAAAPIAPVENRPVSTPAPQQATAPPSLVSTQPQRTVHVNRSGPLPTQSTAAPKPTPAPVRTEPRPTPQPMQQTTPREPARDPERQVQSQPSSNGNSSFNSTSAMSADGERKKKRRRKKKGSGGAPSQGEQVLLVDPSQQGISLSAMLPKNNTSSNDRPRNDSRPARQPQSAQQNSSSNNDTRSNSRSDQRNAPEPINLGASVTSRESVPAAVSAPVPQPVLPPPTPITPIAAPAAAPRVTPPHPAPTLPPPQPRTPTQPTQLQPGQVARLDIGL